MDPISIVVLDAGTLGRKANLGSLRTLGDLTIHETTAAAQLTERIKAAQVVITNKVPLNADALRSAPVLSLIVVTASIPDKIDVDEARRRNITVRTIQGYARESVAQFTIGLILQLTCRLRYFADYVESGAYSRNPHFAHVGDGFPGLTGKQVGIIGLGSIGRRVADLSKALGAGIVYFSPTGRNNSTSFARLELKELLSTSDVVSIHAPRSEITDNLIDRQALRRMKRHAILVNTGRGGIVNEPDLARALSQNLIGGAALDVFKEEPLPLDSPLLDPALRDRLLLTPHCAWGEDDAQARVGAMVHEIVSRHRSTSMQPAPMASGDH
jgi:lactate dehydrogenase-like 2-hydroxyacid dehydrogenase